jgi:uncharacterized alpha-E superfamily protein
MSMLSRVAEHIYWMARYIERAENMARLVNVNTGLQLDLPKAVRSGWAPLIAITGSKEIYEDLYKDFEERSVVKFIIGDTNNPSSILTALSSARENARTIRDIIPRETWEQVNELFLLAKTQLPAGLSQRRRYGYLKSIILGAQQITGLLAGTMTHDFGYDFLRLARNLERADMTSRIIDVRSASLLPHGPDLLQPFESIQWMSVLKSLTAYQMYRRQMQTSVRRALVLKFLLQDVQFPRSFYHCISEAEACLKNLPHNDIPLRTITQLQRVVSERDTDTMTPQELHEFIDDLQLALANVHDQIRANYFALPETETAVAAN